MPQDFEVRPFDEPRRALQPNSLNIGPLTAILIGICVVVALLTKLGGNGEMVMRFLIVGEDEGSLLEVVHHEPWRLLTPIFLHFSLMHIAFNLMAFKDLGTAIEKLVGTWSLLAMVLIMGIGSNVAQFHFGDTFVFGGMSGVVYGQLGYVWMKSRFDPNSGFRLHQQTVVIMIGWFFLCAFRIIPNVANWAHGAGLVIGMIWGILSAKVRPSAYRG